MLCIHEPPYPTYYVHLELHFASVLKATVQPTFSFNHQRFLAFYELQDNYFKAETAPSLRYSISVQHHLIINHAHSHPLVLK